MFDISIEEKITESDKQFLKSKKHLRNMNAFFREDIGIWKAPHPEVDNGIERLRSRLYLKNSLFFWLSRLYKTRKRRLKRNGKNV